jgi:ABC-2 type transport system permease protein
MSLIQAAILLAIGLLIGIHYDAISIVMIVVVILLLSFALTSLGLALGSYIESLEGFQLIVSFVVFPLYFLSGALFPLNNLPTWLSALTILNPVTYAVDAIRETMLGISGKNPFLIDTGILLISVIVLGTIGILSFRRMKTV